MSYSSSKIEKFSENSRFFTFFHKGFKINYFGLYSTYFRFLLSVPTQLWIHKDQLSNNKEKEVIRLKNRIFFKLPTRPGKIFFSSKN